MKSIHDGMVPSVFVRDEGPDRPESRNTSESPEIVPVSSNEKFSLPDGVVDKREETTSRGSAGSPVGGVANPDEHDEGHGGDGKTVSSRPVLTLIVDNYDSFTYSIFQYLSSVNGIPPVVVKNDEFPSWEAVKKCLPNIDNIVISPGPGHPGNVKDFGISWPALQEAALPTLGICLGHQGFASVFGGKVNRAPEPVHGRKSAVDFLPSYDLFRGIEQGTTVLRYHSLVVERANLPSCLEVTCWTRDEQRLIMGLRHKQLPLHGIQFHPESVGTANGFRMLENFRDISLAWWRGNRRTAATSARQDDVDTLSTRLLREGRLAVVSTGMAGNTGLPGDGGKDTAEKDDEALAEGEDAAAKGSEAALEGTLEGDSAAATAGVGGISGARTNDATDEKSDTTPTLGWVVNVAVVPRVAENSMWWGGGQQPQQQVKVEGDRNGGSQWLYDQAAIFEELFAKEHVCFWLDSSSADEACTGVHARKHYSQRACVSYMGGCSGPFAEAVEYYEKDKKAVFRYFTPEGKTTAVTLEGANLFQVLTTRLQRFLRTARIDVSSYESGSGKAGSDNCSTPSSRNSSTFSTTNSRGRGFCSNCSASNTTLTSRGNTPLQVRWWEMRDGVLLDVGDDTSVCCSTLLQGSPMASLQKEDVKESAAARNARNAEKQLGNCPASHAYPPLGFVGGYVGFFSYELRHLMECYERVSSPVLDTAVPAGPVRAGHPAAAATGRRINLPAIATATAASTPSKALGFQSDDGKRVTLPPAEKLGGEHSHKRKTSGLQQKNITEKGMPYFPKEEGAAAATGESTAEADVKGGDQPKEEAENWHPPIKEEAAREEREQRPGTQRQQKTCTRGEKHACDAVWVFADRVVAFDLEKNIAYVLWLTLSTHVAASLKAAVEKEKENAAQYEQSRRTLCGQCEKHKRHSSSPCLRVPAPAADTFEDACPNCETSLSTTTGTSASPAGSSFPSAFSSCDSPVSSITKNLRVESAGAASAKEVDKCEHLPVATDGHSCSGERAPLCESIDRMQLSWATQTVQQLLNRGSDSHAAPAVTASEQTMASAGGGRGWGNTYVKMAERREQGEREKGAAIPYDEEEADRGVAAAAGAVNVTEHGSGTNGGDDTENGDATNATVGGSERSGRTEGKQESVKVATATQRKSKRTSVHEKEEEKGTQGDIEAVVTSSKRNTTCWEERREEDGGETQGEIEDVENVKGQAAREASATGLGCTDAPIENAAGYISSPPLHSSSPSSTCCTPTHSSSVLKHPEGGATWLLRPRETAAQYLENIKKIFEFIASGDAYEVCLTTEFTGRLALQSEEIFQFYCFLRKRNPTPFGVFFRYQPPEGSSTGNFSSGTLAECKATGSTIGSAEEEISASAAAAGAVGASDFRAATADPLLPGGAFRVSPLAAAPGSAGAEGSGPAGAAGSTPDAFVLCCASPELFLLLDEEGWLESRPIKGTRPRGSTPAADAALAQELVTSEKDAAENIMVVDVVRSDLGRVSVPGSVHVPELLVVESYSRVHQLTSTVRGKLRPELSFFDAVAAAFPGASMTGAPKKRVMNLLNELEQRDRGIYSGAIGFLSVNQQAALNIPIRTLVFRDNRDCRAAHSGTQKKTVEASLGAGGAVLAGSNPEDEVAEMYLKAYSVLSLLHEFLSHLNTASV